MKITRDMYSDGGVRLETMADYQDDDETGIKAEINRNRVCIKVDSYNTFGSTIYLNADDAEEFGILLIEYAKSARAYDE